MNIANIIILDGFNGNVLTSEAIINPGYALVDKVQSGYHRMKNLITALLQAI